MLKTCRGILAGVIILIGSAYVTPTYASSASIIVTAVQAGSPVSAKDEVIILFNAATTDVDLTGWCVTNKSGVEFACFQADGSGKHPFLPAAGHGVVVSTDYLTHKSLPADQVSLSYVSAAGSSGSIVNSADTISLIASEKELVTSFAWTSTIPSGKSWLRQSTANPFTYNQIGTASDWKLETLTSLAIQKVDYRPVAVELAVEPTLPPAETPSQPVTNRVHPLITELLPDADGSDVGHEFIELYNPSDQPLDLTKYSLKVGPTLEKTYVFPAATIIPAGGYKAFFNDTIKFTLLNTASTVQLTYDGQLVGEKVTYQSPPEAMAWALINGSWQYTNIPTPDDANEPSADPPVETYVSLTALTSLKPCTAHQYRSAETGRCRNIPTVASIVPCKTGQERNSETGRCRAVSSDIATTACKEGQERNPETNRCRAIAKLTKADYPPEPVTAKSSGSQWYVWLAGIVIGGAILGYAAWEWRAELKRFGQFIVRRFSPKAG